MKNKKEETGKALPGMQRGVCMIFWQVFCSCQIDTYNSCSANHNASDNIVHEYLNLTNRCKKRKKKSRKGIKGVKEGKKDDREVKKF